MTGVCCAAGCIRLRRVPFFPQNVGKLLLCRTPETQEEVFGIFRGVLYNTTETFRCRHRPVESTTFAALQSLEPQAKKHFWCRVPRCGVSLFWLFCAGLLSQLCPLASPLLCGSISNGSNQMIRKSKTSRGPGDCTRRQSISPPSRTHPQGGARCGVSQRAPARLLPTRRTQGCHRRQQLPRPLPVALLQTCRLTNASHGTRRLLPAAGCQQHRLYAFHSVSTPPAWMKRERGAAAVHHNCH